MGDMPGIGNINLDPLFKDATIGDFHLKSISCGDAQSSPCIDAGSSFFSEDSLTCDQGLETAIADMGAYGGQISLPCSYLPGDVNGNGATDGNDVTYFVNYVKGGNLPSHYCSCIYELYLFVQADVNSSCSVNGIDVTYFINYLKGGPQLGYCPSCPPSQ